MLTGPQFRPCADHGPAFVRSAAADARILLSAAGAVRTATVAPARRPAAADDSPGRHAGSSTASGATSRGCPEVDDRAHAGAGGCGHHPSCQSLTGQGRSHPVAARSWRGRSCTVCLRQGRLEYDTRSPGAPGSHKCSDDPARGRPTPGDIPAANQIQPDRVQHIEATAGTEAEAVAVALERS